MSETLDTNEPAPAVQEKLTPPAPEVPKISKLYFKVYTDDMTLGYGQEASIDVKTDYYNNMTSQGADPAALTAMLTFAQRFVQAGNKFFPIGKVAAIEFVKVVHGTEAIQG